MMVSAEIFLQEMELFLKNFYSEYSLFEPKYDNYEFAFFRNYRDKKLSIVIYPSVAKINGSLVFFGKKIKTVLKTTKGKDRVILTDTLILNGWKGVLREKIEALEMLVNELVRCDGCRGFPVPLMCKSRERGTNFVSMRCYSCQCWINTTYGIGLKTLLHRHLKPS